MKSYIQHTIPKKGDWNFNNNSFALLFFEYLFQRNFSGKGQ